MQAKRANPTNVRKGARRTTRVDRQRFGFRTSDLSGNVDDHAGCQSKRSELLSDRPRFRHNNRCDILHGEAMLIFPNYIVVGKN